MLKLVFIFLIGIAYAVQTRIKIGSKSWGYQIELNQGQNIRNEFSNDEGITNGLYIFRIGNETKQLKYRIDPNTMEPDISFDVTLVPGADNTTGNDMGNNSTMLTKPPNNENNLTTTRNMSFDSIDSNQDFKGHVTLKVGNSSYNLNFLTGDKSNSREETMSPTGVMYGRFNFQIRNSLMKIVINYKFNSTSPDPTFEVSLHKMIDSPESTSTFHPSQNYRVPYQRSPSNQFVPTAHTASPQSPIRQPNYQSISEKVRSNPNFNPNWYFNRAKTYEP